MVPIGGRWVPAIAARDELLQNSSLLDAVERRAPGVAAAVRSGNLREFQRLMVALGQQPRQVFVSLSVVVVVCVVVVNAVCFVCVS